MNNYKGFLIEKMSEYLDILINERIDPQEDFLKYDFFEMDKINSQFFADLMIKDELRETVNFINQWGGDLRRWGSWNKVFLKLSFEQKMELQIEFVDAIVHRCLCNPSAIRDRLTFVVTNAMHQILMLMNPGMLDELKFDVSKAGKKSIVPRKKKEERLREMIANFSEGNDFFVDLISIDDDDHKELTFDYRNLNSHSIGPRLGFGLTRQVVRSMIQPKRIVRRDDGYCDIESIPDVMVASYSYGGTPPLDLEKTILINLEQYRRTRSCYENYRKLLRLAISKIPNAGRNL